jgi:hypothetical protein
MVFTLESSLRKMAEVRNAKVPTENRAFTLVPLQGKINPRLLTHCSRSDLVRQKR